MSNASGMRPIAAEWVIQYTQQFDYDADGNVIYIGRADIGTATTAALWQIRKMTYSAAGDLLTIQFAKGDDGYTNIWDNRASLAYS